MRAFEVLILLTLFLRLAAGSFPPVKRSRWIDLLPILTLLLVGIHLVLEKHRWQMLPAYGLVLLLFLLSMRGIRRRERSADKRPSRPLLTIVGSLLVLLVFAFAVTLPVLLPVFRFPEPTGPYPVGTAKLHLVDRTRPETFTTDAGDHRELMVQIWYPAELAPDARPAPYREKARFPFSHLSLVRTHSRLEAPVSNAQPAYPVLIFSHGATGFVDQNLSQMEELASHGYVVFSIAHTYHALETVFPDGRFVPGDASVLGGYLKGNVSLADKAEHLRIWTADTRFVIDELERLQTGEREDLFAGKLDMARLGIFGMSLGGTTAIMACAVDERCQAGIDLDGSLAKESAPRPPFMFMLNESKAGYARSILNAAESDVYAVIVRGSAHINFTDISLYSPALQFTAAFGPIDGQRMVKIINAYTLAFFDKTLKSDTPPLLEGPSPDYADVGFLSQFP